jgi:serine/threonine protein kinase
MLAEKVNAPEVYPRSFGKYRLLSPLAQGGMGSLYLACQGETGLEKLCVVKTVLPHLADKEYVARFRDEAKVVVQLSHGNLVPVFDAGMVAGELYIAMDFIDGKDLRAVWNRCARRGIAFPVDVAVHIVRELARGLSHAHRSGIQLVHRDVSPPNVLLAFSGEVKLTDFGLASSTLKCEKTAPGVIYGKVSYMAPEQARGEPLDGRADQYAAGVILWELLTGRQLFPSGDSNVLDRVRHPEIEPPSYRTARVPPDLDVIVMRALATHREDRFPDCESFRAALAEFLAREAPATDAARVAGFLYELFGEEIEDDRRKRQELIAASRPRAQSFLRPGVRSTLQGGLGTHEPDTSGVVGSVLAERYQVLRLIGEGGMGRIYEGEHVDIGKRVAIKLLHPAFARSPALVERFRREARAASRIGHPNIIDITDSGTTEEGGVFFVMEYLEGQDLAHILAEQGQLPIERSVPIAIQVARALQAAHAAGIVHRDLKPENIYLVNRPGQQDFVKILDFGIACQIDIEGVREGRLTDPGMAMGTPEYMAPEQAAGNAIDGRADIYSVGAILYEMLAGRPPHQGKNLMELLTKKATAQPDRLTEVRSEVSSELAQVVAKALARRPSDRQKDMDELARGLERCRPDRRRRTPQGTPAQAETPNISGTGVVERSVPVVVNASEDVTRRLRRSVEGGAVREGAWWKRLFVRWGGWVEQLRSRSPLIMGLLLAAVCLSVMCWAWTTTRSAAARGSAVGEAERPARIEESGRRVEAPARRPPSEPTRGRTPRPR